jgi:MFS family permease
MQIYDWEPGIGDPTFVGWFTVAAYLLAAILCAAAAMRTRWFDRRAYRFWILFTVLMVALGINKQLDLQSLFTVVLKQFAKSTGWYEDRRIFQGIFICIIAFFGLAFAALAWIWTSRTLPQNRLTLLGGIFLLSFIVIRAASFHHIDQILGRELAFLRINHVLELGGIACVALGTFKVRRETLAHEAPQTAPAPHSWKGSATGYPH